MRLGEQDFQYQQCGADNNSTVGKIENRPLILLDVDKQEVHNTATGQAIPKIAYRSPKNQRERDARGREHAVLFPQ